MRPDESRDDVVGLYRRVWAHADATWWASHRERVEAAARQASEGSSTNAAG